MRFPANDTFERYKVKELVDCEHGRVEAMAALCNELECILNKIAALERQFTNDRGEVVGVLRDWDEPIREIFTLAKRKTL